MNIIVNKVSKRPQRVSLLDQGKGPTPVPGFNQEAYSKGHDAINWKKKVTKKR